jgi:hypothetical protein
VSAVLGDVNNSGQTAEDRFFGVNDPGGITAIAFTFAPGSGTAIEIDHIQFGDAAVIPEPSSCALCGSLALVWLLFRRRR